MENQQGTDKIHKGGLKISLQQEIKEAFQSKHYNQALKLAKNYSKSFPVEDELVKIINLATEKITEEHFIKQCEKDLEQFCRDKKRNKAYIVLQKIEKMNPEYEKLPALKQLVTHSFKEETLQKKKLDPHESIENLLEEGLIYFYQQKYFDAAQRFQTILNVNPHHLKAKNLLDECQKNLNESEPVNNTNPQENVASEDILGPIIEDFLDFQNDDDDSSAKSAQKKLEDVNAETTKINLNDNKDVVIDAQQMKEDSAKLDSIFDFASAASLSQNKSFTPSLSKPIEEGETIKEKGTYKLNFITLIILIIAIFATVWLIVWGISQYKLHLMREENDIAMLTEQGMEAMNQNHFVKARTLWKKALKIAPNNEKLNKLMQTSYILEEKRAKEQEKILDGYLEDADRFLKLENFEKTRYYIGLVEKEDPNHKGLPEIKKKLKQGIANYEYKKKQAEKLKQKKVKRLLQETDFLIQNNEYEKAKKKLQEILYLDKDNSLAIQMFKMIQEKEQQ